MHVSVAISLCVAMLICSNASADTVSLPEAIINQPSTATWFATPDDALSAQSAIEPPNARGIQIQLGPIKDDSFVAPDNLLGRGYNGLSAEMRGTCLAGKRVPSGNNAKIVDYSIQISNTSEEYKRIVNMSAGASFGIGIWGGDASVAYFQSSSRSHYVDHMVVRVTVSGPKLTFEDPKLTAQAKQEVKNNIAFYRHCGNRYIKSLALGGEFAAVIDIETSSEDERSQLRATLSVIAKGYGSGSADYATALQRISTSYQKSVRILRNGTGEQLPGLEIADLIKYSLEFPAKINEQTGVPMNIEMADYQTVDPSIQTFSAQEIVVDGMSNKFGELFEWSGDLDYYARKRNSNFFYPPMSDDEVRGARDQIRDAVIKAKLAFNACVDDPRKNCQLSAFPDVHLTVPRPARQIDINPKIGSSQFIGFAGRGERKQLIILGNWSAWDNGENNWWPPERCCFTVEIAGESGTLSVPYQGPTTFAGPARVSVRLGDSTYGDNRARGLVGIVY